MILQVLIRVMMHTRLDQILKRVTSLFLNRFSIDLIRVKTHSRLFHALILIIAHVLSRVMPMILYRLTIYFIRVSGGSRVTYSSVNADE